jgi:hypothetical protein
LVAPSAAGIASQSASDTAAIAAKGLRLRQLDACAVIRQLCIRFELACRRDGVRVKGSLIVGPRVGLSAGMFETETDISSPVTTEP